MIEIDLDKLERGTHEGMVTVRRGGKVFSRKQKLGVKEKDNKGTKGTDGVISFDSYADVVEYVDERAKKYSSKNEFYTTDEYKALYPILKETHKRELGEWSKDADKAMKSVNVKPGDKVQYTNVGTFMSAEKYTGVIVLRSGVPYVKLDSGQSTVDNKKLVRWHKGWKK